MQFSSCACAGPATHFETFNCEHCTVPSPPKQHCYTDLPCEPAAALRALGLASNEVEAIINCQLIGRSATASMPRCAFGLVLCMVDACCCCLADDHNVSCALFVCTCCRSCCVEQCDTVVLISCRHLTSCQKLFCVVGVQAHSLSFSAHPRLTLQAGDPAWHIHSTVPLGISSSRAVFQTASRNCAASL